MSTIKDLKRKILLSLGIPPHRWPLHKPHLFDLYEEQEELCRLYAETYNHTVVDRDRMLILRQFALQVSSLEGDAAEVGVFKGGTAYLISSTLPKKDVHLFDTFEGMPETVPEKDWHKKGDFSNTSLQEVTNYLSKFKNAKLYPGYFPATAGPIEQKKFCFVHIDVDIYQSVIDCCEFFYPRLVTGGVLIFDDYGFPTCPGAKAAVDEFFKSKKEAVIYFNTGQAMIYKLPATEK